MISDTNKGSYFSLKLNLEPYFEVENQIINQKIENAVDIVLSTMSANENVYKFKSNDSLIYLFGTTNRKRKGQLDKLVDKNIIENQLILSYTTRSLLKTEFNQCIETLKKKTTLQLVDEPIVFSGYRGEDIKFLDSKSNWYPWQLELYNELYYKTGEIRTADTRKITFLYDPVGNVGKSMWIKHLYIKNPDAIAKVSSGNASQLRSCLIGMGTSKKIYFIDLPRSKEKYSNDSDILNAIEDLKNGFISSPMYGRDSSMIMEPPHIIVSSNYLFEDTGLSKDRWIIYEIGKAKNLINITQKVLMNQLRKTVLKKQNLV